MMVQRLLGRIANGATPVASEPTGGGAMPSGAHETPVEVTFHEVERRGWSARPPGGPACARRPRRATIALGIAGAHVAALALLLATAAF